MATSGFAPVIAVQPGGTVLVGWWDDERTIRTTGGHPFDLMFRIREPGRDWSAVTTVPGARSSNPEAAVTATQRSFALVSVGSDHRLQVRPFEFGKWSAATTLPNEPGRRATEPALLAGPDGQLLLTWRSFGDQGSSRARAALAKSDTGFVDLFTSPVLGIDDLVQGGLFSARGTPIAWFSDPRLVAPCTAVVWTERADAL